MDVLASDIDSTPLGSIESTTVSISNEQAITTHLGEIITDTPTIEHNSVASTTKSPTIKRRAKPVLADHHYSAALNHIGVILISFSFVMLVCTAALYYYTNRRRRLDLRCTSSSIPLHCT